MMSLPIRSHLDTLQNISRYRKSMEMGMIPNKFSVVLISGIIIPTMVHGKMNIIPSKNKGHDMKRLRHFVICLVTYLFVSSSASAQDNQWVEGFDTVTFHNDDGNPSRKLTRDFRGTTTGYFTAGWWIPGHSDKNYVSWKTAAVPKSAITTFAFI